MVVLSVMLDAVTAVATSVMAYRMVADSVVSGRPEARIVRTEVEDGYLTVEFELVGASRDVTIRRVSSNAIGMEIRRKVVRVANTGSAFNQRLEYVGDDHLHPSLDVDWEVPRRGEGAAPVAEDLFVKLDPRSSACKIKLYSSRRSFLSFPMMTISIHTKTD